jgi:hypothetical protein
MAAEETAGGGGFTPTFGPAAGKGGGGGSNSPAGPFNPGSMSAIQWQQLGLDWWSQRTQRAIALLNANTIQVDSPKRFDFTQWPPLTFGTTPPVPDLTRSGAYVFSGASDGALEYSPAAGSILLAQAQTESWFMSVRCLVQSATLVSGEYVLLGLIDLANVHNPAGSGNYVKIGNNTAFGADGHLRLWMDNGALALGADLGVIGGPNIPNGAPFTIDLYNDLSAGALVVAIQDTEVARLLPSPTSPLNSMPTVPLQLVTSQNGSATTMIPVTYGGFAMLKGPTT